MRLDIKLDGDQQLRLLATLRGTMKMRLLLWDVELFERRYRIKYNLKRTQRNLCSSLYPPR
jgi:hypothetical protein